MDAFVGEIRPFALNWAPADWLLCTGASVQIYQYQVLYAVIGTLYGSADSAHFNLPNLMSHGLMGSGVSQVSGTNYQIPTQLGTEGIVLNTLQMPAHNHSINGATGGSTARVSVPTNNTHYIANFNYTPTNGTSVNAYAYVANPPYTPSVSLNPASVSQAGGNNGLTESHENRQPLLTIGYYICYNGYFPARP